MEPNINDFTTAPLVKDYFDQDDQGFSLEMKLSNILEKQEEGKELNAVDLVQYFQFHRFFTWTEEHRYEIRVHLSGRFCSEHTMTVDKDLFDSVEEGDTDYDHSDLLVDSYALDDARDGVDIEDSEVESKYKTICVSDLKIKDEFNKDVAPDAESMIEGGAA